MSEKRIRALWRKVPSVNCKGLCHEACTFIEMSRTERVMLERAAGQEQTTLANGSCSLLKEGRCSAYASRPMLCRLFGAVPEMPCKHGCEPVLTSAQGARLMRDAGRIGGRPDTARLTSALERLARELGVAP